MNRIRCSLASSIASLALLVSSIAHAEVTVKIINGNDATPGAWPFMVALIAKTAKSSAAGHFCGGSLIGPQHILTAAHCVSERGGTIDPRDLVVQIGGDNLSFNPLNGREVLGITTHPEYDEREFNYDFAILKLKEPVSISPVGLALSTDAALYTAGATATVLGFGKTDPQLSILPFVLQQASIPLVSDQTCMDEIGRYFNPVSQLCAGVKASSETAQDGIDSCQGDSGGPLFVSDGVGGQKQVGVVSWGIGGCANHRTRGVYSKVMSSDNFLTSYPQAKPIPQSAPSLLAPPNPTVGSTLTCSPSESFYGDAPTLLTYRWYRYTNVGNMEISGASSNTYTATAEDNEVFCTVEASNSGGSNGALGSNSITLASNPPPPPPQTDTTKPTGSIRALTCNTRSCSFVAIASDNMSGVSSVKANVEISYLDRSSQQAKGTKAKRVIITRVVRADSKFNSVWEGEFRLARKVRQRVKVTLLVRDWAGNNNVRAGTRVMGVLAD